MRQVLTNLLTNAHLYTGEGGRVAVAVEAEDRFVSLDVSDTGQGMTPEEVEQVFDRFYRAGDGAGPAGTGLGLSIVRSLVDLHGGTIDVESEPGRGTTFRVLLPRALEPEPGADAAEAIRGKRVLVIDDEPAIAELIVAQLAPFEVDAVTVHSGEAAMERLRDESFDAVTLDILMPGMSGFEVLRAIRSDAALTHLPVVIVSVFSGGQALHSEWAVSKPIDADELTYALGSAVIAGRVRALVVGRAGTRAQLEPELARLGIPFEWATNATAARGSARRTASRRPWSTPACATCRRCCARSTSAGDGWRARSSCSPPARRARAGQARPGARPVRHGGARDPACAGTRGRRVRLSRVGASTTELEAEVARLRAELAEHERRAGAQTRAARALRGRPARDVQARARAPRRSCAVPTSPRCGPCPTPSRRATPTPGITPSASRPTRWRSAPRPGPS